ncbi:protein DcaA [Mergibacter septicus]|uniref:Protein DcaA n=2 Tax=Mergibacter septicus TaxID=221402 RepID=A0A8E3MFY6_9PAST|nr:sulfatase-like hydrolase/transferase [Mergibacter septicus]AWX14892.1 protein DcaA [Mergibacter septicus]QDJ14144.1 protein DcaA [Mergibacter septicus]UTU48406.1 phosphoethanolamine transferase [Mergibacter septicus]
MFIAKLSGFKRDFVIINIFTLMLFMSEIGYRIVNSIPPIGLTKAPENYLITLLFVSLYYFARFKLSRLFIFFFFFLSIIINNIHFAVYQNWVNGLNYYLAIKEWHEVYAAGIPMLDKLIIPLLWGTVDCLIFLSIAKYRRKTYVYSDILFILLIVYISIRSFSTSQEHGISPKTNYGRIKANYYSFGYFLGRILPYQLFSLSSVPEYTHKTPEKNHSPKIKNIILIMGEAETATHVSAFGYSRKTTPFFEQMQEDQKGLLLPIYSAGKMTAISLPSFFNAIPYPNGMTQINQGNTSLFRLAKENNFHTYFYTAQAEMEMAITSLFGKRWIEHIIFPTHLGYDPYENISDNHLIPLFEKINLNKNNNFIVLHQRGSHTPYGKWLEPKEMVFGDTTIIDKYDSTIFHTDQLIKQIYQKLIQRPEKDWILIYTSDHGQYVTDQVYNQGTTVNDNYIVPLFIYTPDTVLQQEINHIFSACKIGYHQQLATLIIDLLGYKMPIAGCDVGYVNGNLLTGDNGYYKVQQNGKIEFINPKQNKH